MKPAIAAFALLALCSSSSFPQEIPPHPPATNPPLRAKAAAAADPVIAEVSESELRQRVVGRPMYLRGLWLDETLHFDMDGNLVGQSPKGSFTLCGVLIDHVHVTKKSVEMEGIRYGIHFEDEAQWKDQATSFDRIQITPRKKHQIIVIDRQLVVIPKKNGEKGFLGLLKKPGSEEDAADTETASPKTVSPKQGNGASAGGAGAGAGTNPEDAKTTTSPAESAERLRGALNKIFAPDLDAKMVAEMPDYWQFFYQAQQAHKSLVPTDAKYCSTGAGDRDPEAGEESGAGVERLRAEESGGGRRDVQGDSGRGRQAAGGGGVSAHRVWAG